MPAQEQKSPADHLKEFVMNMPFYIIVAVAVALTGFCEIQVFTEFIPNQFAIMRFAIIAFTEGGALGWMVYNHYKAETAPQLAISFMMLIVCCLTSLASVALYLGKMAASYGYNTYSQTEGNVLTWVVILVIPLTIFSIFGVLFSTHRHLSWFLGAKYRPLPPRPNEAPRPVLQQQNTPPQQSQRPSVRVEEERPQKPLQAPPQRQAQLPQPAREALPAAGQSQARQPVQQPSQYIRVPDREDEDDFLATQPGQRTSPLPGGGKQQRQPYPPQPSAKKTLPEQQAHLPPVRRETASMETLPMRSKRQREAEARDQMIEAETRILPQTTSPSEQVHWNQ